MKTSKRLAALFLTLCLMLSMFVPALYIEGEAVGTALPIAPEIECENIIYTVQCEIAATGKVGDDDYLYLFFKDGLMLVYNLETDALVDTQTDVFSTPIDAYVDENGIVWVCGAERKLYRYDPKSGEGTSISIPGLFPVDSNFSVYGISGDGQGNLYFGTYDCAYLGKYNSNTGEFSNVDRKSYSVDIFDYEYVYDDGKLDADAIYSGKGGIHIKGNYAYLSVNGDKNGDGQYTHKIIKYELSTNRIVQSLDYSGKMGTSTKKMPDYVSLVGGKYLICSTDESKYGTAIVDISGESMALVDIPGLTGIKGAVSDEIDGKVYFMSQGGSGLMALDIATGTVSSTGIADNTILACEHGSAVTIGNDPALLTFTSPRGADTVDLKLYNLTTGEIVEKKNYTDGDGSGNQLRSIALSEDGTVIYVGAYQTGKVAGYDITVDKTVEEFYTLGQNDSLLWYNGYLYAGMYSYCSIGQYTPSTGAGQVLSRINNGAFYQNRAHAIAAGDGMVFIGTVPGTGHLGGVLMWYSIAENRIYVAAGPTADEVYYTSAGSTSAKGWRTRTGALADDILDTNGDGTINSNDAFVTGVIENQSINNLIYKDGYLIGSTSRYGGSGSVPENDNACLFIYDVDAKAVVATCDVTNFISGLTTPVDFIDAMAEDPETPGKFWGVVSDTLFSFAVNLEAKTISNVTEELSLGKSKYTAGGCNWDSRDILFDGDFMYVVFGQNGTYMIERDDVSNYVQLSTAVPKQMVQAIDGNIYYVDNTSDLKVLNVAEAVRDIKDEQLISGVEALISALKEADEITLSDEAAVSAARAAYEELSDAGKAQVDITKLVQAEAVIAQLNNGYVRLKYEFGVTVSGNTIAAWPGADSEGYPAEVSFLTAADKANGFSQSSYLNKNQNRHTDTYNAGSRYVNFRFNGVGSWAALKIYDVQAGTYDLDFDITFDTGKLANIDLYLLTGNQYKTAISGYLTDLNTLTSTTSSTGKSTQYAADVPNSATYLGLLTSTDMTIEDVIFTQDGSVVGEYVLIFVNRKVDGNSNVQGINKLHGLIMNGEKAAASEVANPAVTVGGVKYANADDAIKAIPTAAAGTDVTIHKNMSLTVDIATEANIVVEDGVSIDLAGNNLTAPLIGVSGTLIDTGVIPGLVTGQIVCTGDNGGYLPLTDGTGYRMYKVNTQALGLGEQTDNTGEFGFHADFDKRSAYTLTAGLDIKVNMTWDGGSSDATAEDEFVSRWASEVSEDDEMDIVVTVKGLEGITGFKLKPVICVNGVSVEMSPIARNLA